MQIRHELKQEKTEYVDPEIGFAPIQSNSSFCANFFGVFWGIYG